MRVRIVKKILVLARMVSINMFWFLQLFYVARKIVREILVQVLMYIMGIIIVMYRSMQHVDQVVLRGIVAIIIPGDGIKFYVITKLNVLLRQKRIVCIVS